MPKSQREKHAKSQKKTPAGVLYDNSSQFGPRSLLVLDPSSYLVEFDLLARDQGLLQGGADFDGHDGTLEPERYFSIVEAAGGKLVGLGDEGVTEPTVIVWGNLAPNSGRVVDVDQVGLRLGVDGEFAFGSRDLGRVLLPSGHHARAEELSDLAAVELDDPDRVITVVVLS